MKIEPRPCTPLFSTTCLCALSSQAIRMAASGTPCGLDSEESIEASWPISMARQVFDDYYWSSDTWKSCKFGLESNWDFGMICAGGVCEEEGWVGCLSTPASPFFASLCLLILHTFPLFIPLGWITIRTPISSHNWRGIASHPQVAISSFFKALRFSGHSWVSNRTGPCSKGGRVLWGRVVGGRDFIPRGAVLSPPAGCSWIFDSNFYREIYVG